MAYSATNLDAAMLSRTCKSRSIAIGRERKKERKSEVMECMRKRRMGRTIDRALASHSDCTGQATASRPIVPLTGTQPRMLLHDDEKLREGRNSARLTELNLDFFLLAVNDCKRDEQSREGESE